MKIPLAAMSPRFLLAAVLCVQGVLDSSSCLAGVAEHPSTFCNPVDLSYRFYPQLTSRREADDPAIVWWRGEYWLFASKSGGYWHSKDFAHWQFVAPTGLPLENYAPVVEHQRAQHLRHRPVRPRGFN